MHKRDREVNEHDEYDDDNDDDDNTRIGEMVTGKSAEDAGCVWY